MQDYDLEATAAARERILSEFTRDICGICQKPMYKVPLFPGVPTEWRHASTSHSISWTPEKHLAAKEAVSQHQHRFEGRERLRTCVVAGCDSELLQRQKGERTITEPRNEREAKEQESRLRGNRIARQRRNERVRSEQPR